MTVIEIQYYLEIIIYDPSIYTMDQPDVIVSNVMENSIGLKRGDLFLFRIDSAGVSLFDNSNVLYEE